MRGLTIACMALVVAMGEAAADGLRPGMVLSKENWQLAADLLPPEILDHYRKGEYVNTIGEWKDGTLRWSEDFVQSTKDNADRFEITAGGTLVDKSTGRRPPYIYGFPFPRIDPADPHAAVKILWNYFYGYWANGSRRNISVIVWLAPKNVDRRAVSDVYFHQYDGQPPDFRPKENPNDLLQQFLSTTLEPVDLQGTAALSWRYRAGDKRDSNWAFVPALRRVRQVSPANRSDGFLGSDVSQDDGPFFDAKPEDFAWRVVREQRVLRLADPYSLSGDYTFLPREGGGWRVPFKPVPMVGFQQPDWKGISWAPVNFVLVERPAWLIEGVPHDRYYLFGKVHLYIDKENYRGCWSRKFNWKGEPVAGYQIGSYLNDTPDGKHYMWGHGLYYQLSENFKRGTGTWAGPPPSDWQDPANDFFVPYDSSFFSPQTLLSFGK